MVAISSYDTPPFRQTLDAIHRYLAQNGVAAAETHFLAGDSARAGQAFARAGGAGEILFLTLGTPAVRAVLAHSVSSTMVSCMVLSADLLRDAPNATGVVMEFPLETQLAAMRRVLPKARTVGVLYNPEENKLKVEAAARMARKFGLTLYAREVSAPRNLPDALERVLSQADALWGLPDQTVLAPETARAILLASFRARVPFIGLSDAWVKAGAIYALEWDYDDLGQQCAATALRVLQGARPKSLAPAAPRKFVYSINARTANHMNIEIPRELLQGPNQIHQ